MVEVSKKNVPCKQQHFPPNLPVCWASRYPVPMSNRICEILNGRVYGGTVSTQGSVHFIPTIPARLGHESRLNTLYGAVAIRSAVSCIVDRTKEITQGQAKENVLIAN
jgi:hypothetical protein